VLRAALVGLDDAVREVASQDLGGARRGDGQHGLDRVGRVDGERRERQLMELLGPPSQSLGLTVYLGRRPEELDQHRHLGAQHLRNDRGMM